MITYIKPEWNIQEFKNLEYFLTTYKDNTLIEQYVKSGHVKSSISLYNYHEPSKMPDVVYDHIKPHFDFLDNVCVAINYFKPGQYLPLHIDKFDKYLEVTNNDITKIVRYIVMLEDSYPGQIIQIKNKCVGNWKSGDCFSWKYNEIHTFYNFSINDRYAIQVTGVHS